MEQQTKILEIGNGRTIRIPVNYQHFILDYSNSPEGHGWNREDVVYILECINKSLLNLNRKKIDICLLHNWTYKWNNEPLMIDILQKIKNSGLVDKIGISLPNMFNNELSDQVLKVIDVIECPYNSENNWILNSIDKYKKYGIEIILRSLFEQGKLQDK